MVASGITLKNQHVEFFKGAAKKREHVRNIGDDCKTEYARIQGAARCLADQPTKLNIDLTGLMKRFDLTEAGAREAAALARRYRICRQAFA